MDETCFDSVAIDLYAAAFRFDPRLDPRLPSNSKIQKKGPF